MRCDAANGILTSNGSEQTLCHVGPGGAGIQVNHLWDPPARESQPFESHLTIQTHQTDSINTQPWTGRNISMTAQP